MSITITKVKHATIYLTMAIFPVTNLVHFSWCNVIQQIKKCGLTSSVRTVEYSREVTNTFIVR